MDRVVRDVDTQENDRRCRADARDHGGVRAGLVGSREAARAVRGIYADLVGWFDGNATHLFPLPEKDRATRLVAIIGGADRVIERGRAALAANDVTWAAELADYVLVNDASHVEARRLKASALTALAERQVNAIARNYYLTTAQFLLKDLPTR